MEPLVIETFRVQEHRVAGKRLGRHVAHDPRSWNHPAPMAHELTSTMHKRLVPIFNQGDLGSCTGNAAAGCISTAPFKRKCKEADAVAIYKAATIIDNIEGAYPPEDTGSTGLAVMKVLQQKGWISRYTHAFSLNQALRALVLGPGVTGINWRSGCDSPDREGIVHYKGSIRGGHEIELVGLDVERELVWFANSWGSRWGKKGCFAMTFDDYGKALADHGDATFPHV